MLLCFAIVFKIFQVMANLELMVSEFLVRDICFNVRNKLVSVFEYCFRVAHFSIKMSFALHFIKCPLKWLFTKDIA